MRTQEVRRGGAPVGYVAELSDVEAGAVIYMRLWCDGSDGKAKMRSDFEYALGHETGLRVLNSFEQLFCICTRHGRRPLMRHAVHCKCLGSDESCFANFIATAANGDYDDAMLIATLMVRPDMAPMMASLAVDFGLALKRMSIRHPGVRPDFEPTHPTIH